MPMTLPMDRNLPLQPLCPPGLRWLVRAAAAATALAAAFGGTNGVALAQQAGGVPQVSQPVVQALPSRESLQLSAALAKLGRNPRDIEALVEAGDAASALGDFDAAIGFFKRAQQISRSDARVAAGLAGALVRNGDPYAAIPLFEQAEKAGADQAKIAGNRGLAYDLVGDPATAQRYYQMALAQGSDDEVLRRLAVSLAISGDARGVERTLLPLLRRQDKAAWRARAFSLAILGSTQEAIKITKTLLPAKLAENITPYLQYMPRLTRAQQAAAANLGRFPRASEVGRDDPRVAQYAPSTVSGAKIAAVGENLVPAGRPLNAGGNVQTVESEQARRKREKEEARRAKKTAREAERRQKRVAPPEPKPVRTPGSVNEPVLAVPSQPPSVPVSGSTAPGFDLASLPSSQTGGNGESAGGSSAGRQSFSDTFGDLGEPKAVAVPAAGAVDIRKIDPARPAPREEKPARIAPPSHPSRIWVQLGIGQKTSALSFDWRRIQRKAPELLKGRKAYVSKLNQTNRMLVGPFESNKAAADFLAELRKAGIEGPYLWTSPAGQVVDAL